MYLRFAGPIELLSARAAEAFGRDAVPAISKPMGPALLEAGAGLFLCRPADADLALREAMRLGAPRADFKDCSLVLFSLRIRLDARHEGHSGLGPIAALTWLELARAKRRTGPAQ